MAKNSGAAFDASKYVFIQRDIEIVPATSRKAVDFEERSKKIYQQYLAQQQQKAAEERKIAQQREQEKKIIEAAKREAARLADDQEPTQSEMGAAIRRSTLAGALLDVSVQKIGACRKAASYDYYCRYRWFDVNWGNFWKQNGEWHFKIANQ
ncbi:MAG: hypothetical protein K0U54_06180 [Bacteroidetes bacterium]|nr:hypothetical protein [Bacteroidota bacterium]